MKKFTLIAAIAAVMLAVVPVSAAEFKLNVDYSKTLTPQMFLNSTSLKDVFDPGILTLDLDVIDKTNVFEAGIANFEIKDIKDYNVNEYKSLYLGVSSPNLSVFYSLGNSSKYLNYFNSHLNAANLYWDSEENRRDLYYADNFALDVSRVSAGTDLYSNFNYKKGYAMPDHFGAFDAKLGKLSLYGHIGSFHNVELSVSHFNPYMPVYHDIRSGAGLMYGVGFTLNVNTNLNVDANFIHRDFDEDNSSALAVSVFGKIPVLTGNYRFATYLYGSERRGYEFGLVFDVNKLSLGKSGWNLAAEAFYAQGNSLFSIIEDKSIVVSYFSAELYDFVNNNNYLRAGVAFEKLFKFDLIDFNFQLADSFEFADYSDFNITANTTKLDADFTINNNSTINLDITNTFVKWTDHSHNLHNDNNTVFSFRGNFFLNDNIKITSEIYNVVSYFGATSLVDDYIYAYSAGYVMGEGNWDLPLAEKVKSHLTLAGLVGYNTDKLRDPGSYTYKNSIMPYLIFNSYLAPYHDLNYRYNVFAKYDINIDDIARLSTAIYAGDDVYSRTLVTDLSTANMTNILTLDSNLTAVASITASYSLLDNLILSATGTYRSWRKGTVLYNSLINANFGSYYTVEDNFFVSASLSYLPAPWACISLTWGRSGLASDKIFDSSNASTMKPWSRYSIIPTYGHMDYKALELSVNIKF